MSSSMPPDEPRDVLNMARASKNPLHALTPPEPDAETLARIWRAVEPQLTPTPEQRVVRDLRAVPLREPDAATLNRIWHKTAREMRAPQKRALVPLALRHAAAFVAIVAVLLISVNALSAHALPGDPLYSAKRFGENVRVVFTRSDAERAQFALERADARLAEARKLAAQNASPALLRQTIAEAVNELNFAAPFVPSQEILNRREQLSNVSHQSGAVPDLIETPTPFVSPTILATATRVPATATPRSSATPLPTQRVNTATATFVSTASPLPTLVPTLVSTPPPRILTESPTPLTLPTQVATHTPAVSVPTLPLNATGTPNTPNPPTLPTNTPVVPTSIIPTVNAPTDSIPTVSVPTVSVPTVPVPTVPQPTAVVPTVSAPTVSVPTLPPPTVPVPTAPNPTAPVPTVAVPTNPPPTVPTPTGAIPTVPLPTLPLPTLPLPNAKR